MNNNFQPIPAVNGTISDIKSMILKEKDGFTLAETLITLTVIGVVAALTVPSLMTAYKDKQLATAKKKAMSILGNGYKTMQVKEEDISFVGLPIFGCGEDFSCLSEVHRKVFVIGSEKTKTHDGLPEKYLSSMGDDDAQFSWDDVPYIFTATDGITYGFFKSEQDTEGTFSVAVDLNGEKSPNQVNKDIYKFRISNGGNVTDVSLELNGDMSCSASNVTKCKKDEDIEALYQAAGASDWQGHRCTQIADNKYLAIHPAKDGGGGGCPGLKWPMLNSSYCYKIVNCPNDWECGYVSYCN